MKFLTWFDVNNYHHVKAYKHLHDTGCWPEGFIPDGMKLPHMWQVSILNMFAAEWTKHIIEKEGRGRLK